MQAMILQKNRENDAKQRKEVPDIAGDLGYPPRYEPSSEQLKLETKLKTEELRKSYQKQIEASHERKQLLKENDLRMDKIFVSGYRTAKNRADFRHTTGNMGMLLS